jgi:biopolymer transport protein ExbD
LARRSSVKPLQEMSEINMTPLIDLTFLLLITFILIMPAVEQGIPVNLPKGKAEEMDQKKTHSITLDVKGGIFLDSAPISKEQLASEMKTIGRADPDVTVMVRGDADILYGKIVEIMGILHDAEITRMALVTQGDEATRPAR